MASPSLSWTFLDREQVPDDAFNSHFHRNGENHTGILRLRDSMNRQIGEMESHFLADINNLKMEMDAVKAGYLDLLMISDGMTGTCYNLQTAHLNVVGEVVVLKQTVVKLCGILRLVAVVGLGVATYMLFR